MSEEGGAFENPTAVKVAETVEHTSLGLETANTANQAFGLTAGARVANAMEEMGGFGEHAIEGMRGPLNGIMESPIAQGAGGVLGLAMGGYNMAKGIDELTTEGHRGQGAMDLVAGGAGVFAGGASLGTALGVSAACPIAAPIALAAGLAASGNERAAEWGMFGKGEDGKNRSGTDFIADSTSGAYHAVDDALGGGVLGTIGGGLAGGAAAIGSGILGIGGDIIAGAGGLVEDIGGGIASGISAIASW